MGTVVHYKNKKTGVIYAYESIPYWDKNKQQGRSKRKCIGHVDSETGEIVPNRPKTATSTNETDTKNTYNKSELVSKRTFYGATYLFDSIGDQLGITNDLKKCFPNTYKQILSIAYFLILEDSNALSRFPKWAATHKHPFGDDIPSQRSSDLFASIKEDDRMKFFRLQGARRVEKEYLAYDTTSISSYSEHLRQVQHGYNKEHDPLAQLNLALLFGEESGLPFYYRQLPGNIPDTKTLKNLLADVSFFGYDNIHTVMDRGFYSEENVNELYQEHIKFLIGVKLSLKFVEKEMDESRDMIRSFGNYSPDYDLFCARKEICWDYTQKRPYKGDELHEKRRMYLYMYYNSQRAADDEREFALRMTNLSHELKNGNRVTTHESAYAKYFDVKTTPVRGIKITAKEEVMQKARKNFGYFALISNDTLNAVKAIEIYRNKDLVEKAFNNIKDRLNCRRIDVSSELSLSGKLFVEFIALIFLSYIKNQMQEQQLFKKYTLHGLLDKLDIIECYEHPNACLRLGEMTELQKQLFTMMGVRPPA